VTVLQRLGDQREQCGVSAEELEGRLLLGPGWIDLYLSGLAEPPLSLVIAIAAELGVSLDALVEDIEFTEPASIVHRQLTAEEDDEGLILTFMFGSHETTYQIPHGHIEEFDEMLRILMSFLEQDQKTEGVARAFLYATTVWPEVNPSDLWYFIIARAFHDPFNYPAAYIGADLAQSWKRTSGWALERIFVEHYGPALEAKGIYLMMPPKEQKIELTKDLGLAEHGIVEKADILLVGLREDLQLQCFGVVHVKASFAERRTDDVPLSEALIANGYVSPLVTMDCKGVPGVNAENPGELGLAWDGQGDDLRGPKRRDIEVYGKFDACFSFNSATEPTPEHLDTAARVISCRFGPIPPDEPFVQHVVDGWQRIGEN
jgi:transcriptional regulator with XRE-family HTH domain